MQEPKPSEARGDRKPHWLTAVFTEGTALLRASDTFKLVTTEGAKRLSDRAGERQRSASYLRGLIDNDTAGRADPRELRGVLAAAEAECSAQEALAKWLQRIGGKTPDEPGGES